MDPERLTIEVHAYLKNYQSYDAVWKGVLSYPLESRLKAIRNELTICGNANDKFADRASAFARNGFVALPDSRLAAARILALELGAKPV